MQIHRSMDLLLELHAARAASGAAAGVAASSAAVCIHYVVTGMGGGTSAWVWMSQSVCVCITLSMSAGSPGSDLISQIVVFQSLTAPKPAMANTSSS